MAVGPPRHDRKKGLATPCTPRGERGSAVVASAASGWRGTVFILLSLCVPQSYFSSVSDVCPPRISVCVFTVAATLTQEAYKTENKGMKRLVDDALRMGQQLKAQSDASTAFTIIR